MTRYFAIGAAKGWTQIRRASKPPVAVTTEAITQIKRRHLVYDHEIWDYRETWKPGKIKLKVTVYEGGSTIWTLKSTKLASLLKASVREGGMIELLPEQVERIKQAIAKGK